MISPKVVRLFEPREYHLVADHVLAAEGKERQDRARKLVAYAIGMAIVVSGREATMRALRSILRGLEQ